MILPNLFENIFIFHLYITFSIYLHNKSVHYYVISLKSYGTPLNLNVTPLENTL